MSTGPRADSHPPRRACSVRQRAGFAATAARLAAALVVAASASSAHAGLEEGRAKAQVCVACHGVDGNATNLEQPSLAGQPRQFLVQALFMFREGQRKNALMTPFAANLSNADLNDLALFYSSQKMAPPTRQASPELIAKARAVSERNNCVACHKPSLVGQQHIPRLAGQNQPYLLAQLKSFKASTRADLDGTMTSAAQGLALDELEPLAEYLSTFVAP